MKKITDHGHSNTYITTQQFTELTLENFGLRLVQANSARKNDIAGLLKNKNFYYLNNKVTSNNTKKKKKKHVEAKRKTSNVS